MTASMNPSPDLTRTVAPSRGFQRVLVLVDDSFRGGHAVGRLAHLAWGQGARIVLLGLGDERERIAEAEALEHERERLLHILGPASQPSIDCQHAEGSFDEALSRAFEAFSPELIVFAFPVQTRGLFRRLRALTWLRRVEARQTTLLQVGPRPVVQPYQVPLLGLSAAATQTAILETVNLAVRLSEATRFAALHVLDTSYELVVRQTGASEMKLVAQRELERERTRGRLEAALADALGSTAERIALEIGAGDPADTLQVAAKELGADLIVLGSPRGPPKARLGALTTAERLLLDAPCDIALAGRSSS